MNLPSILTPDLGLLFWMALAFLVVLGFLAKYALPAIVGSVENRKRYIDDSRYCRFFIHDKLCYNGWGRRKIEQALYAKKIGKDISDPLFEELETAQYLEVLRPLINKKWKTVKARDDYERATKVIRFAMGRGFSYDQIRTCIDELSDEDHGEYSDPHF